VLTGRLFIGEAAPVSIGKRRLQGNRYIRQSLAGPERQPRMAGSGFSRFAGSRRDSILRVFHQRGGGHVGRPSSHPS
jgi:hypothetical protein